MCGLVNMNVMKHCIEELIKSDEVDRSAAAPMWLMAVPNTFIYLSWGAFTSSCEVSLRACVRAYVCVLRLSVGLSL